MTFWAFMFLMVLLCPLVMLAFGCVFVKSPPKKINSIYGYRTTMSKKNRETWDFAHRYCGVLWRRWGGALMAASAAVMVLIVGKSIPVVSGVSIALWLAQMAAMLASIGKTEKALKAVLMKTVSAVRRNETDLWRIP